MPLPSIFLRCHHFTLLAALLLPTGCYFHSQPDAPYGSVLQDPSKLPAMATASIRPLRSSRLIVLGRFDSTLVQPIGGLYDSEGYSITPLSRTYAFGDAPVVLFEHVADALREAGLHVLKDYAGNAEPALLPGTLRGMRPLLVVATVRTLQHDLFRDAAGAPTRAEAVRMEVELRVTDTDGTARLAKPYTVSGARRFDAHGDTLADIARKLVEQLSLDPDFDAAIEATHAEGQS